MRSPIQPRFQNHFWPLRFALRVYKSFLFGNRPDNLEGQLRKLRVSKHFLKAELLQLELINLFAKDLLFIKNLEIEKTKPTFLISVFQVEYLVVLVSSISNFFCNKMSLANKWMWKKIPFCCN